MRNLLVRLHNDDAGIVTLEYLVLATFIGLGVIVGAHVVGAALNEEATEVAQAITGLDQSWTADGYWACDAIKSGGAAIRDEAGTIQGGSYAATESGWTDIGASFCDGPSVGNPSAKTQ